MLNLFSAIKKKDSLLLFCRINKPQVQRLFMKIIKHGNFYNITYVIFSTTSKCKTVQNNGTNTRTKKQKDLHSLSILSTLFYSSIQGLCLAKSLKCEKKVSQNI